MKTITEFYQLIEYLKQKAIEHGETHVKIALDVALNLAVRV